MVKGVRSALFTTACGERDCQLDDAIERCVRELARGYRCAVHSGSTWIEVVPDNAVLPAHGWKLHVSSRPSTFPSLVLRLVPVLLAEGCVFKLARSQQRLADLNDGLASPASVGKAATIYPRPDRVRALGTRLVVLLRGEAGPRIRSDQRIDDEAPVYYRYGAFSSMRTADSRGRLGMVVRGPAGEEFDGEATTRYRRPSWVSDPFTGGRRATRVDEGPLLGDRYRVTGGV